LFAALLHDPQTAAIKAELKWLTGELGPARELDVLVHRVVALMMTTQDLARHVINPQDDLVQHDI
jgi:triphosphatase